MKKILSVLLVLVMLLSFAACAPAGNENTGDTNENTGSTNENTGSTNENTGSTNESLADDAVVPASALEVLENIWALYGENDKFFAMGGDYNNIVDNAPGAVDVSTADFLTGNLIVPEDQTANVTDAASLVHSMNANTFTGAAYCVSDVKAFATAMQTAIQGNQWICGFPEMLLIASVGGDYVVVAFGHGDAVGPFQTKLAEAYPAAEILVNEAITG